MKDLLSVIIPVYNVEKYLANCINCIINQTYENLEIILIDDGSTDHSLEICNQYALKDERIKVFHKDNGGVSSARNVGLKNCTGTYITFVDSDDALEVNMYEQLINRFTDNISIVHCGYKRVSEAGNLLKDVKGSKTELIQNSNEAIEDMLKGIHFVGGLWNKIYKKDVIKNTYFDENLKNNEDILFNVLAFQNSENILYLNESYYIYYEHPTSACNTLKQEKQLNDTVRVYGYLSEQNVNPTLLNIYKLFLYNSKCRLYRFYIMNNVTNSNRKKLKKEIKSIGKAIRLTNKDLCNQILLLNFSGLYKLIYKIYDRIRKPNWDTEE